MRSVIFTALLLAAAVHGAPFKKRTLTGAGMRSLYATSVSRCRHGHDERVMITLSDGAERTARAAHSGDSASFHRHSTVEHFASTIQAAGAGDTTSHKFSRLANGLAARLSPATLERMMDDPDVAHVEADCVIRIDDPATTRRELWSGGAVNDVWEQSIISGNTQDTSNSQLWGIDRIDDASVGTDHTYDFSGATGAGTRIYILDTGVRTSHHDFGGRALPGWSAGCQTLSSCGSDYRYKGDISQVGDTCSAHGTHCASTAAGSTYGVAKGATIVAVQVLGCSGSGYASDTAKGIEWAAEDAMLHNEKAVISMSLGGGFSASENAMINEVVTGNDDIMVVVAAGNDDDDACNYSPASAAAALTVGATQAPSISGSDKRASYSSYGSCLDIFAPGSDITAAYATGDADIGPMSGTSMACPHVAGAAAQLRGKFPELSASAAGDALLCLASRDVVTDPESDSPNLFLQAGSVIGSLTAVPAACGITSDSSCDDTDNGASDPYGDTCGEYDSNAGWCGLYDGASFSSMAMCCVCGGGVTQSASPPPAENGLPGGGCDDSCNGGMWASDGECDDGGPNAQYAECSLGTDCTDCGGGSRCYNTCVYHSDGECDDGGPGAEYEGACSFGDDCDDCGSREVEPGMVYTDSVASPPDGCADSLDENVQACAEMESIMPDLCDSDMQDYCPQFCSGCPEDYCADISANCAVLATIIPGLCASVHQASCLEFCNSCPPDSSAQATADAPAHLVAGQSKPKRTTWSPTSYGLLAIGAIGAAGVGALALLAVVRLGAKATPSPQLV